VVDEKEEEDEQVFTEVIKPGNLLNGELEVSLIINGFY